MKYALIAAISITGSVVFAGEVSLPEYHGIYQLLSQEVADYAGKENVDKFKVAADSNLEYLQTKNDGLLVVVKPDYKDPVNMSIRGATGNGWFYVFNIKDSKWNLVVRLDGKTYDWLDIDKGTKFITMWGNGSGSYTKTEYLIADGILISKKSEIVELKPDR